MLGPEWALLNPSALCIYCGAHLNSISDSGQEVIDGVNFDHASGNAWHFACASVRSES